MLKRLILALMLCLPAPFALMSSAGAVTLGDDGLHKQDWFSITFRDMREDMQSAAEEGKRLAIIIEQRGCIYCKKVHEEILTDPQVRDYIKANYKMVQYNLYGDEEVIDLDGEVLTEKTAARKWGIAFTPTILFLPEEADGSLDARQAAVAAMPGAREALRDRGGLPALPRPAHPRAQRGGDSEHRLGETSPVAGVECRYMQKLQFMH
jgi:thioredoxin-related protein